MSRFPPPRVTHPGPKVSLLFYGIGRAYLTLAGWRCEGELPKDAKKWIMIAAPHTSGWDLPYMLACAWVYRIRLNFLGKHTLFAGWRGPFMRFLGGIPVDRRKPQGLVSQVVEEFDKVDGLFLAVPPAGTRKSIKHWKSGFYHIARGAGVPVVTGFLDYERKVTGLGPTLELTGDVVADMDRIRAFYADKAGMYPERAQPIRLKDELEPQPA